MPKLGLTKNTWLEIPKANRDSPRTEKVQFLNFSGTALNKSEYGKKTHSKSDAIEPFWTYNELLIWASFTILSCNWSRVSCVTVCTAPGHDLHVEPLALWQSFWCRQGRTGPVGTTTALAMDVSTNLLGGWGVRPFAKFMSYWSMACREFKPSCYLSWWEMKPLLWCITLIKYSSRPQKS